MAFQLVQQKVESGHVHLPVLQLNAWTCIVCFPSDLLTPHQDLNKVQVNINHSFKDCKDIQYNKLAKCEWTACKQLF